ncbi:CPBP family intramembrane metalloprotease [Aequorivita sp. H23M31]|uniref:CPBP family intramembrane metalloprotease n=1 Tax=Aequorivita ciconiae TaxID=2494375 RepID=A0A410FZV0_9FLAO|nr:CPBP family intramembrane glutamic endopeptidase [Aequorivita sp. H23M31]QAA80544.1 CPBP family intramembrane metalloprotease [Aequorivita sp. H23M31]
MKNGLKAAITFATLFVVYHCAEFMIVFKNSTVGFLGFQILFFLLAWIFGNWYSGKGLATWGLPFKIKAFRFFALGIPMGIFLYAIPYIISLSANFEKVIEIPNFGTAVILGIPFTLGVLLSSFSEDILTRGIIYQQFHAKIKHYWLIIFSALIYLLNHIYRLTDGPESWFYIFMLGIVFIIPVITTKTLWFTGAMHWAGNVFFFVTHNVIQTNTIPGILSPNYLFAICLLLMVPVVYYFSRTVYAQASTK